MTPLKPLRIGQFSAYFGDRSTAMRELLAGGVDVLTGDYLAELTMLVLQKTQSRGAAGYATSFVDQLSENLVEIHRHGIKVVTNAGGLDPIGCADAVRELCQRVGVDLTVMAITGDNLLPQLAELTAAGAAFQHLADGSPLTIEPQGILTANAYTGAWPIVEALSRGADIVIAGRATDASLVIGPAAWHFAWARDDWDRLAGALWAGHVIECGAQATGGAFSFFYEHDDLGVPGMPIAIVEEDGSSTITKPDRSGGLVSVDTVTAQLLYEIDSPMYRNPDVCARLTTVTVTQVGVNRVRLSGATGQPPGPLTKVSLCYEGGYRNTMTIGVTGARVQEKVAWFRRQFYSTVPDADSIEEVRWALVGPSSSTDGTVDDATALLVVNVRDRDPRRVGRLGFANSVAELGASSIPGFYMVTPPQRERLVGIQWPCLIDKSHLTLRVVGVGVDSEVPWVTTAAPAAGEPSAATSPSVTPELARVSEEVTPQRLGDLFGARSGDKADMANIGVWARDADAYSWLATFLTVERIKDLLPELAGFPVERHQLTNLLGLNFVVHGYLGMGVSSCTRLDAQAKGLGEYLLSRIVDLPSALVRGEKRN